MQPGLGATSPSGSQSATGKLALRSDSTTALPAWSLPYHAGAEAWFGTPTFISGSDSFSNTHQVCAPSQALSETQKVLN